MEQTKQNQIPSVIRRLLIAWFAAACVFRFFLCAEYRSLEQVVPEELPYGAALLTMALVFGAFQIIKIPEKAERWIPAALWAVLLTESLVHNPSVGFLVGGLLIFGILLCYGWFGWDGRSLPKPSKKAAGRNAKFWTCVVAGLFFLFVSGWTVCRVLSFSSPTFDMGIFSQMFHHMRTTGLPNTTVERDGLLSHFAVHVSPVWYLMLPFYCVVPEPWMLQVLQAAVMVSAVIPMWLIGKNHGLVPWARMGVCGILLLYPAFSGGAGYDIHENCFLTPLLLWLFYGLEKRKGWISALFAALTLLVKEDAAVYVAVVGLWYGVTALLRGDRRGIWNGSLLLLGSVGWFVAVTGYLDAQGDGVMTWRYNNFQINGLSPLISVVVSVFLNPMKAVFECADREKWLYILQTMVPLLGLPLLTRRYERYLLLIPYLLVNLMSDYTYQHHIFFQYNFGSIACLIYLTAVNLADLLPAFKMRVLPVMAVVLVCVVCFSLWIIPTGSGYIYRCIQWGQHYTDVRQALDQIPEEASVTATTFYTTHLSGRKILYDVRYSSKAHMLETEFVVLHMGESDSYKRYGGYEKLVQLLTRQGYELFEEVKDTLVIYRRKP